MPEALVGRYQFTREIGRGGFGLVEEYHDLILGTDVAIKTVAPHFIKQETKRLIREVDIMQFLYKSHPHVIDFESMFVTRCRGGVDSKVSMPALGSNRLNVLGSEYTDLDTDEKLALHHQYLSESINEIRPDEAFSLHIVMPLMKGDLTSFIKLCASDSEQQRYSLTANYLGTTAAVFGFQLFLGLDYLHRCGIIHRDLKPENILVCLDQARALNSTLRIADLGLAREMQDSDTFYVCTRYYRAPEVVMTAIKGHPGLDMWSMGCILYEMCTNRTLFTVPSALDDNGAWEGVRASTQLEVILNVVGTPSRQDVDRYMPKGNAASYLRSSAPRPSRLVEYLRNYWILDCPESAKADWIDLITRCLHFFPQQRPTAEEAACHPLFQHHGIYLGRNVKQHPMRSYVPTFTDRDTANALTNENKGRILELVRIVMDNTRPLISDDDAGDHGGSEEENVEDEFTDDDEVVDEEEEEHQPSALAAPLVTIDDGYHMDETHYALDTDTMESSLSSSGSDFDTELFEGSTLRNEESAKKKSKEPSSNSRRQPATSPGKTANEEDEDDGIYGAGSSFARISNAAGNSVGRQKVSSNRRGNGRTRGSGKHNSSTNGNEEEDDDDTAMVPSAARFASAVNLGSTFQLTQTRNNTTQEGSDGYGGTLNNDSNGSLNNTNTGMNGAGANGLRGGRVQSRVLGRRQSRGDGAHEDGDGGTGTPPRTHSAMDASTDRGQDLLGSGVAASSAFLGTTQQESPQRRGKTSNPTRGGGGKKPSSGNSGGNDSKRGSDSGLDDEMDAAAYSALHPSGPGWYTASFFNIDGGGASATNLNRSANGGVTAQGRPRANSGSAAVTISPSTASAVGLGNSAPNLAPSMGYPQQQRQALTVNAQDQQTRVSRSSTVSAKSASFASPPQQPTSNLSAVANQTVNLSSTNSSADFYAGVRASLGSMTDRTLASGNNGATSGRRGMADYDFMLDEGLEASVARPGARRAQPKGGDHTAGTSRARAEEPMFSSLGPGFAPGEYDMGSGLNIQSTALNRGQNRSEGVTYGTGTGGMGFHHTSDHSVQWSPAQQQQEQHAPRARIQPLEPMSNNFFSALNLRTLPAQSGLDKAPSAGHVVGGKGPQPGAGPSASGILAKDFTSPAAYQLDLSMKAPSLRTAPPPSSASGGNQGSSAQPRYGQPAAGAPPSLAQPTHVLEDEDEEWDLDLMPPDESAQQVLGIGSPTGRGSQANMSNPRTGKKRSLGEMGSSQSMLALMEQVAMGASPDVDTLNSSARPHQRKAAPRGQEGTVGADPDFPAIDDAHLRQQFRSVQASYGGVQDAITDILTELSNSTHDAARSDQLRSLLSYFTSLQYSLAHTN